MFQSIWGWIGGVADQATFTQDVEPYLPKLKAAAMRMTRDHHRAEDLVQETLLKGYRRYDTFETGTNLRAWLYTIQTNTYINSYRAKKVRFQETPLIPVGLEYQMEYDVPDDPAKQSVEDQVVEQMAGIAREDIVNALCALPADFLRVLLLADSEGLHYKEAAEVLGIPVGTVMSRLSRGRSYAKMHLLEVAASRGLVAV